ncbi:MAG: hypothetical protein KZQ83_10425 [gamma proteobacterium symbiont of Taylorina sp.]|nr:hypothetical protein [gamma proteobacterium symbiont of Taylorina sp.]
MNTINPAIVLQYLPTNKKAMNKKIPVIVFLIFLLSIPEINAAPRGAGSVRSSNMQQSFSRSKSSVNTSQSRTSNSSQKNVSNSAKTGTANSATRTSATATRTTTTTATRHGHAYRPAHRPGHRPGHLPAHGHRHYAARGHARHHYHRWYRGAAWFALGAYVATRPRYTTTVYVSSTPYYYSSGVYYVSSGTGYTVVSAPSGAVVYAVPTATTVVYASSTPYYYYGGTYYVESKEKAAKPTEADVEGAGKEEDYPPMTEDDHNYKVVSAPVGATVPYLPDEAKEETIKSKKFWVYENTYYQAFVSEGDTIYMVVENPGK